jgi:hypothetical protein
MKLPGYCRSWQDRFKDSDLDRRRDYWCWGEAGDLLLVRPGPALDLAREFVDNLPPAGPRPRIRSLAALDTGRVTVSHTALRRQGDHAAEQVSQLRLGAGFETWFTHDDQWLLGCGVDRYPGWLRSWHLVSDETAGRDRGGDAGMVTEENAVAACREMAITSRQGQALASPDPGAPVLHDLSFGTRLEPVLSEDGFTSWCLPDGRTAWTPDHQLTACDQIGQMGRDQALARLMEWGEQLAAIPYEWGGSSSGGFDCSGLIQTLFALLEIELPRDADLQARIVSTGTSAMTEVPPPGALLFYGRDRIDHVGLLLPGDRLLHCRGLVQTEPLGERLSLGDLPLSKFTDPLAIFLDR